MKKLEEYVRSIPDFPEPGIIFRDVTSILQDADGLCLAIDRLREMVKGLEYDVALGGHQAPWSKADQLAELRGFLTGE